MPGKLNLYNLGDLGVHLVETPVHSPDGSFTSAQNATVSLDQGQHGLRKRYGLRKLNPLAMDGPVLAIDNMPFPDPFAPLPTTGTRVYAAVFNEGPTGNYVSTTDGVSWGAPPGTVPLPAWWVTVFRTSFTQRGGVISTPGRIIYVNPPNIDLYAFDGTTNTPLTSGYVPGTFGIQGAPTLHDGVPVLALFDATSGKLLRQSGSTLEELTTSIGKPPICVASALGRVYIGTDENRIYYWSDTGGLVLDTTLTPTGGDVSITDIAHSGGVLYASGATKAATTATTHKVLRRTGDGAWSDITPEPQGNYGPIASFDGVLYVVRKAHDAFNGCEIRRYDGSAWLTPFDVGTVAPGATDAIALVVWNGALYATVSTPTTRDIIRLFAGTWANVHSEATFTTQLYTALGFY